MYKDMNVLVGLRQATTRKACLHENNLIQDISEQQRCAECKEIINTRVLVNTLMQRVAALERAVEYFGSKEFGKDG